MRRDREREPHVHARRVELDGRLDELLKLGEGDYLVELFSYLDAAHAEYRAVQIDVLAPREVGMKARADFEQRADAAVNLHFSGGRPSDAREDFKKRRLARAVVADDAHEVAAPHLHVNVAQRPDGLAPTTIAAAQASERRGERVAQHLAQRRVARMQRPNLVALANAFNAYRDRLQPKSPSDNVRESVFESSEDVEGERQKHWRDEEGRGRERPVEADA